jgi:hypothetical protein
MGYFNGGVWMNILEHGAGDYFHGVVDVCEGDEGVWLKRVTDLQMAHYESCNDRWPLRARCDAGGALVLRTNSKTLDVSFKVVEGARQYLGLDVEVDGVVVRSVYVDDYLKSDGVRITNNAQGVAWVRSDGEGAFTVRLYAYEDREERAVWVHLPQSVGLVFAGVVIEEGASVVAVEKPKQKLLCLGDSITQGMDAMSPMTAYTTQLARLLDAELLNQGVGGHIFDVDSFDAALDFEADIVTIAYGTNDWNGNTPVAEIQENVRAYLEKVRARYSLAEIFVLSPIWRTIGDEVREGGTLWDFSRVILETAGAFKNVRCLDGLAMMPHQEHLLPDGTHPNDEGFLHYGLNLYREIKR